MSGSGSYSSGKGGVWNSSGYECLVAGASESGNSESSGVVDVVSTDVGKT